MSHFVDPRANPEPSAGKPPACTTDDPALLEELHLLCRQGRLYEVERWITAGRPLQLEETLAGQRRRVTALQIAIKQQHQALVLLLLCNGYDPNLEPQCALDIAFDVRRTDLAEFLIVWGADPHEVDRSKLFDTYDSRLFERFYRLGVDLTAGHVLAEALGYHTSNKPLFGFAKRHREGDPQIQRELDMALAHHAGNGNEKGTLLCLWAGGDPHAAVPALGYDYEDDDPEEDGEAWGSSAVFAACLSGHAGLLERFAPDPTRDNFDSLYRVAPNADVIDLLAHSALPADMTAVVQDQVRSAGWYFGGRDTAGALRRLFELGARWTDAPPQEVGQVRRMLFQTRDYVFKELVQVLGTEDYCAADIRRELARTAAFQKRMQTVGLMPEQGDRGWSRRRGAKEAAVILTAFGLEVLSRSMQPARRTDH